MTPLFQTTRERSLWWLIFALGVCLSLIMALRSQIGGDQRLMLQLGFALVVNGDWLPYGMPTSAGGHSPGGLMGLLMAIPLWIWLDYRSPALFIAVLHAAGFLLLAYAVRPSLTRRGVWLLLLLVWLNPWRMYFSAHIWNSSLMFVAAILHFASAQRMTTHREAWNSCFQVVLIALAMQVHTSAAVLAVLSLLLLWKGMIKVHWGGFVVGMVLGIAAYVPWLLAINAAPELAPGEKGFFGRGLVYVFPFLRGVLYWLKMSSLTVASRMVDFDFSALVSAHWNTLLVMLGTALGMLAHLTLIPSAWAHWRFVRKMWQRFYRQGPRLRSRGDLTSFSARRSWLRGYIALSLVAALFSFAISPTTIMFWQVFISIPAAALVLIMATEVLLRTRWQGKVRQVIELWSAMTVLMLVLQAYGTPHYRCNGVDAGTHDAILRTLHVPQGCQ